MSDLKFPQPVTRSPLQGIQNDQQQLRDVLQLLLSDPTLLPQELKNWLPLYVEQTLDTIPASVVTGLVYPWVVDVDVFSTAATNTNWDDIHADPAAVYNGYVRSSSAQNDAIGFDVVLSAGTWTVELLHPKNTQFGIFTVALDGTQVGTVDAYSASLAYNLRSQIAGIVVQFPSKKRLTLTMATKNASSSGYLGAINHIRFTRTA